jgi:dolichol-phosphate mannosyltransferase
MNGLKEKKEYKKIAILPVFNESKRIRKVIEEIPKNLIDEILLVDDCSTDNTKEVIKNLNIKILRHKKNLGVGAAIRAGLFYGLKYNFDIAVILSGGGKTPPKYIQSLLEPLYNGYDFVQGSRYLEGGKLSNAPIERKFGTRAYTFLFSFFCGRKVTDASSGFRAFFLNILKDKRINLKQKWLNRYELEPYLLYKVLKLNYKYFEVPVEIVYPENDKKYSKMKPIIDWWKIFRPVIFLKFNLKK